MEKPTITGDNRPEPVGRRWTTPSTVCGSLLRPQPVEIFRPRIHRRMTWPDDLSTARPVDTICITSRSPGCGREKVPESVEEGRNVAGNRTHDDGTATAWAAPQRSESRREAGGNGPGDVWKRPESRIEAARQPGRGRPGTPKAPSGTRPGAPSATYDGVPRPTSYGGPVRPVVPVRPVSSACAVSLCRQPVPSAVLDAVRQLSHLVVDGPALGHERADLAVGVHDGGVVAVAELRADLGQ